jgi:DNA-binding cell septation regulator SpoVG
VVIDRCIQIEHIHIIEKCDGIYIVAMPSKYESGKFHDIAHPITREARSEIDRSVLKEFSRVLDSERLTNAADHVKVSQ